MPEEIQPDQWGEIVVASEYGGIFVRRDSTNGLARETWVFVKDPRATYDASLPLIISGYNIGRRATKRHKFEVAAHERWSRLVAKDRNAHMQTSPPIPEEIAAAVIARARETVRIVEER